MSTIYSAITILLLSGLILFFGMQLYKLGMSIKEKFPIIYRIYVIFWSLILAIVLIGGWFKVGDYVDRKERENKIDQALISIQNKPRFTDDNRLALVGELRSEGYSDREIFEALNSSDQFKDKFNEARLKHNMSNYDIAKEFGISPY